MWVYTVFNELKQSRLPTTSRPRNVNLRIKFHHTHVRFTYVLQVEKRKTVESYNVGNIWVSLIDSPNLWETHLIDAITNFRLLRCFDDWRHIKTECHIIFSKNWNLWRFFKFIKYMEVNSKLEVEDVRTDHSTWK